MKKSGIIFFLMLTVITGLIYPMIITGICQLFFSYSANGSLVKFQGKQASVLVGQEFSKKAYFWSRPSGAAERPYNLMAGASSNLDPKGSQLRQARVTKENFLRSSRYGEIIEEMVSTSGSGLDPDISPNSAYLQIDRISSERHVDRKVIEQLIAGHIKYPLFKIFGEPRVNVFILNMALDENR